MESKSNQGGIFMLMAGVILISFGMTEMFVNPIGFYFEHLFDLFCVIIGIICLYYSK